VSDASAANTATAPTHPGLFISFEGIDGVGKTTQVNRLREYFREKGCSVTETFEPGGTQLGAAIRHLLLSNAEDSAQVSPRAEALLYAADRAEHVHDVIAPALERGQVVITDRYLDSSIAYQAGGRELSESEIEELSMWATGHMLPDRTYLLDMDPRVSHERLTGEPDRLESEPDSFQNRTRQGFLARAAADPRRFCVIDAAQDVDAVWEQIRTDVDSLLESRHLGGREQSSTPSETSSGAQRK
jgi:dTMP kinase